MAFKFLHLYLKSRDSFIFINLLLISYLIKSKIKYFIALINNNNNELTFRLDVASPTDCIRLLDYPDVDPSCGYTPTCSRIFLCCLESFVPIRKYVKSCRRSMILVFVGISSAVFWFHSLQKTASKSSWVLVRYSIQND